MERSGFIQKVFQKLDKLDHDKIRNIIAELSAEKELYTMVFDSMIEGVIVINHEKKIVLMNAAMENFISTQRERVLYNEIDTHHFDDEIWEILEKAIVQNVKVVDQEVHIARNDKTFLLSVLPLLSEGESIGHIIILVDITEKRKKEIQLRRAESLAALTTLSAGVAHEIKNPLTSIDIHIQLLQREIRKFSEDQVKNIKHIISVVKEEIERLNSIVQDFLFAVRPMSITLSKENVNNIIMEVIEFVKYELKKASIAVELNLDENISPIIIDPKYLHQALLNVIKNAMQAIHGKGKIIIKTEEDTSGDVLIHVIDNGEGIPKELQNKIFEPYFTTRKSGTGLGLVIVYKVIKELGGDIAIRSKEGRGTEFIIKLPIYEKKKKLLTYEEKYETKTTHSR